MSKPKYARGTEVPVEQSRAEVERILTRYGAEDIGIMLSRSTGVSVIVFYAHQRQVKLSVKMPTDAQFNRYRQRLASQPYLPHHAKFDSWRKNWLAAEERRQWRVLVLRLKAKLEWIEMQEPEDRADTFRLEFLAETLLPDNRTVGESIQHNIEEAYAGGKVKGLLPGIGG